MLGVAIIAGLLVKHFIMDFPLQTAAMRHGKGIYGNFDGITHSLLHGVGTFFVLLIMGVELAGPLAFLDLVIHYHVDWSKNQLVQRLRLTTEDQAFWNLLGLDQLAHGLTYVLLAGLALA